VDSRIELHHAAQIVAAAGVTFLAPRPDDSHPNFAWEESLGALVGHPLPDAGIRAALRVADLRLLMVDGSGTVSDEFPLAGRTLEDGYAWLASAAKRFGGSHARADILRPDYEIPDHPVGAGARFTASAGAALGELARWFGNGHAALTDATKRRTTASTVRCWPHHFDLGSLEIVATRPDGSLAKSVGVGLSPGDAGYAEPYWYVSPWPYPEPASLTDLASGHWHTEGYTAAILTGSDIIHGAPASQSDRVAAFLATSIDAARRALAE
jgi:hypothetical protein